MSEKEFLQWIYDRLVNAHNENELYDYMHKFKEIINTRAVPDVPELVRYRIWFDSNYNEIVDEEEDGEYVRYSQAAKVIAAKDKEIKKLKEVLRKTHASFENDRTGKFKDIQNEINKALSEKESK